MTREEVENNKDQFYKIMQLNARKIEDLNLTPKEKRECETFEYQTLN